MLLAGYLPFGVALGLVYAPMSTAAMAAMPGERSGSPPGSCRWTGCIAGTIALAGAGAIFHALLGGGDGFAAAIAGSTWLLVGLWRLGTALTWAYVRDPDAGPDPRRRRPPPEQRHHHTHHRRPSVT